LSNKTLGQLFSVGVGPDVVGLTFAAQRHVAGLLNPRGPDWLHEMAAAYLSPGNIVLDAGCRDAEHLIRLIQANQVTGVGVDAVEIHIQMAHAAVEAAGLNDRIMLLQGVMHDLPYDDGHFDFVWCRDVLEQVDNLDGATAEVVRVMKPQARLLVYTTVATELLEGRDAEMMRRHLGNVEGNLDAGNLEEAFRRAGLVIERKVAIGTEWREYVEERTKISSRKLLQLARLRRQREEIIEVHGQDIYEHVEANLHWELFQFLGKLMPRVYVLVRKIGNDPGWVGAARDAACSNSGVATIGP
jgi:ubiquinone/menaquinone biosynthesis C-methylase UbiE